MRLLIISSIIHSVQKYKEYKYYPPPDVELVTSDLNYSDDFTATLFDYDVSIVHITQPSYHSMGYFNYLPKLADDFVTAIENGRCVICLPETSDFRSESGDEDGMRAYEWLSKLGIELRDDIGENIKHSGTGQAAAIKEYLKAAPKYHQIIVKPELPVHNKLAVVADTEIAVGMEYNEGKGTIVILPPPLLNEENYFKSISGLIEVARHYYERLQRRVFIKDEPEWMDKYHVPKAKSLDEEIEKLATEKAKYDQIAYMLYGTGDELEESVAVLLQDIGFDVEPQQKGANIDLKVRYQSLGLSYAFEITGSRDIVKKDNNKVSQAWQYISDRKGTPAENDRLVIVANAQCHLNPQSRRSDSFSTPVINLLGKNDVLLITTCQLYRLWKEIIFNKKPVDEFARALHSNSGLFSDIY